MAIADTSILRRNFAEDLGDRTDEKGPIAEQIVNETIAQYESFLSSRSDWEEKRERWFLLCQNQPLPRDKPWPTASNVSTPILATACHQYHSRAYAAHFASTPLERMQVLPVGEDDVNSAPIVAKYQNWQLISQVPEYEQEFDKMLSALPQFGQEFTKWDWDFGEKRPVYQHVSGNDLLLPYRLTSFEDAPSIERHEVSLDQVLALADQNFYINTEELASRTDQAEDDSPIREADDRLQGLDPPDAGEPENEDHGQLLILEKHFTGILPGFEDEGRVAWTVFVEKHNAVLLRIAKRQIKDGQGRAFVLDQYTDYPFITNPGGFYALGYGALLEPLNLVANSVLNQMIDSARMSSMPVTFYGRGAGLRGRSVQLYPGAKIEVRDVKQVLLTKFPGIGPELPLVLQMIERFVQELTSVTDEIVGRSQKGVREPTVGGTVARIEQANLTFGVLIKRGMRQQAKEYQRLFMLNALFTTQKKVFRVLGRAGIDPVVFETVQSDNFKGKMDFLSTADPSFASPSQRRGEAAQLMELSIRHPLFAGNPATGQPPNIPMQIEAVRDFMKEFDKPNIMARLPEIPPAPVDPAVENQMIREKKEVRINEGDNHQIHLAVHGAELEREPSEALDGHITEHEIMLQRQVQAAEAQQQAQAQQSQNQGEGTTGLPGGSVPSRALNGGGGGGLG